MWSFLRSEPYLKSAAPGQAPELSARHPASRAYRRNESAWIPARRNARRYTPAHMAVAEQTGGAGPGAGTSGDRTGTPGWPPEPLTVRCSAYWSGTPNPAPVGPARSGGEPGGAGSLVEMQETPQTEIFSDELNSPLNCVPELRLG